MVRIKKKTFLDFIAALENLTCVSLASIAVSGTTFMFGTIFFLALIFFNRQCYACMKACSMGFAACTTAAYDTQTQLGVTYTRAAQFDQDVE